jgi:hypothetical protein
MSNNDKLHIQLLLIVFLSLSFIGAKTLFYEHMADGTSILAIPSHFLTNSTQLRSQLSKLFHMKSNNFTSQQHQFIDFDLYPQN